MLACCMAEKKSEQSASEGTPTPITGPIQRGKIPSSKHPRLGDLLVNAGIVERSAVEQAALDARAHHERLGDARTRQGIVEPN